MYRVLFEQTGTFGVSFATEERYERMKLNFALNSVWNEEKQRGRLLSSNEQQEHDFLLGLVVNRPTNCKGLELNDHGHEISSLLKGQPRIS